MATNLPILQIPHIAQPCDQSWEQMPGSARVRHCAACNQDVVNLAAMSAAEIAALLSGPVPCLRVARHDDGSLVTTEPSAPWALPRIAASLLTAALSVTAASAAGQTITPTPPSSQQTQQQHPAQTVTMGAPPAARQTAPTAAPTKPLVPSPHPPPHVTMGKILPPVHKPLPNPLPGPASRLAPTRPDNVLLGSVVVTSESGEIPLDPAPLPSGEKSLPRK